MKDTDPEDQPKTPEMTRKEKHTRNIWAGHHMCPCGSGLCGRVTRHAPTSAHFRSPKRGFHDVDSWVARPQARPRLWRARACLSARLRERASLQQRRSQGYSERQRASERGWAELREHHGSRSEGYGEWNPWLPKVGLHSSL
jgi:hypothetical protein